MKKYGFGNASKLIINNEHETEEEFFYEKVKLQESPSLMCFFEVVVIREDGEKITGQVTVQEEKEE
ncbi:MAG: hypothetical protein R6V04_08280 [bacterium]